MRKEFFRLLYIAMEKSSSIYLLVGDLGFGLADSIRDSFPDRFINTGAAEQSMMDMAVGLVLEGKIPFVYSITPFLIYRPWETLRTYVDHEKINVKLVGSGRNADYEVDGYSHNAEDVAPILGRLSNIRQFYPEDIKGVARDFERMIESDRPSFISLSR